ncbi:MAG: site-2 protease family protein [Planctomycetota bacterium]
MDLLITLIQVLLIVVGFGLVVFIHELGHFIAARWAGVRVLAFAVGFGPAVLSYRKGMGLRRGSSEQAYKKLAATAAVGSGPARDTARATLGGGVSPTEYRLNALPLGGYVKMLGQDDADPSHRSDEPDSYNAVAIWKRMVIISAGVVMNVLSAAALFVIVFAMGLDKPTLVIGTVAEDGPAEAAVLVGETEDAPPGLRAGDRLIRVGERSLRSFDDAQMAIMTAEGGRPLEIVVQRKELDDPLTFSVTPERTDAGIQMIGIGPSLGTTILDPGSAELRTLLKQRFSDEGLDGLSAGDTIDAIDGVAIASWHEAEPILDASGGEPVTLTGMRADGGALEITAIPSPVLPSRSIATGADRVQVAHVLGLTPVLRVSSVQSEAAEEAGLVEGDVFLELGGIDAPDTASGIGAIRARAGGTIDAVVLRGDQRVELTLKVSGAGQVGIGIDTTAALETGPAATMVTNVPGEPSVITRPGSRIIALNGQPVTRFRDIALGIQRAVRADRAEVEIALELPIAGPDGTPVRETVLVTLDDEDRRAFADLGWSLPLLGSAMDLQTIRLRSSSPGEALTMGLSETRRIMLTTYLTFLRLIEGSIAPRVLNGPVGIVHAGTTIMDRGLAWMLFFFALISINLAVINFLPIPITDGGHMVFLLWEQVTGRPVSIAVQNIATLAGLVLIVGVFLFVTYHDIARLLGS